MTLHNLLSAIHLHLKSFLTTPNPTKTSSLLCGGLKQLARFTMQWKDIGVEPKPSVSSTSKTLFMPMTLTSFGGTELERQWQATPRCSGSSSPNRCQVGADPIVSSPYGTQQLAICVQIAESQERHLNISPNARISGEYNCSVHRLLTLYHVWR